MEHSLTTDSSHTAMLDVVLILILMEYSLTNYLTFVAKWNLRLNPYSNGILSDCINGRR